MGQWRDETIVLECGCKIGRSGKGMWFYDFICDKHVPDCQTDGHYDYDKAMLMTQKLNQDMREKERKEREARKCQDQASQSSS